MTPSPWLDIPLADYEAHMAHPSVAQAPVLGDLLEAIAPLSRAAGEGDSQRCISRNGRR
jgi:hypothetical protein